VYKLFWSFKLQFQLVNSENQANVLSKTARSEYSNSKEFGGRHATQENSKRCVLHFCCRFEAMFKNRKPNSSKKGAQKKSGGSGRGGGRGGHGGMPHGMPPEMAAAFAAAMGADDDDDFDDEDFDEEDLEAMEEEFESAFGGGGRGKKRDLYEVLGVERSATTDQIKKAFRVAAVKHHPGSSTICSFSVHFLFT
jgi:hypothetical protein